MPLSTNDIPGILDGIKAASADNRLSIIHALNRETGDPVLLLTCTFGDKKPVMVPIAEIIVGRDMDIYQLPDELRDLLQPAAATSPLLEVGIPGYDTL